MTSSVTSDDEGADINVGDSVTLVNAKYLLNGNYRILQLTKKKVRCDFQVEKVRKTLDKEIADLKSWENKGIYLPGSTSWSVSLQGLIGLYHLNEGTGTVAKDKAPHDTTLDGVINDGSWSTSSITHLTHLEFNGGSSYVDLGTPSVAGIDFHATAGVGYFSVGGWFSPSATDATKRFVLHKDGQFALCTRSAPEF